MAAAWRLHLGAAYYPEHWPPARWPEDVRLMQAAGLTVARLGEFAWSTFEPEQGQFNFDWLDRVLELLANAGMVAVLGTPTAAPPAWLSDEEVLAVEESGRYAQFGNRCHYCVNSPRFHNAVQRLVNALGKHFGSHPTVIGWQLDNEYCRPCYCDRCRRLFQEYLHRKFGSLANLNTCWSTAYWSQTYSDWRQIPLPIGGHNPGLMLEFKNFISYSYQNYQRLQIAALRPHLRPGVWITHNFMGWFDGFDHYEQAADLDIAAWDAYVGSGHLNYPAMALAHDLVRGFKRRNFWLMETQPGHVNWSAVNNELNQGEARAMAWQAVGHGAEAVLYWQWRSAPGGQEQYHGTVLDQSGQPRPFYAEVQQLGRDFAAVSELLAAATIVNEVALLNSYPNRWTLYWQRHTRHFDYVQHLEHYARPLTLRHVSLDVLSTEADLRGYRLVIAPTLHLLSDACAARLADFAYQGGHLVLSIRSGMKDEYNRLRLQRPPGSLAPAAGVEVEDYYALLENEVVPLQGIISGQAQIWAERLKVLDPTTEILAHYGAANGWLDNRPAITVHPYGQGYVWFVGAYLDVPAQDAFTALLLQRVGIQPLLAAPPEVEVCRRLTASGQPVFILINHSRTLQTLTLPWTAREHLSGAVVPALLELPPYGVGVVTPLETVA